MEKEPWLPEELKGYEVARKLLGLLENPKVKVSGENYHLYHQEKVLNLLKKRGEDPQRVLEDLLPRGWVYEEKAKPQQVLELLLQDPTWTRPKVLFQQYLRKNMNLRELKQDLGLPPKKDRMRLRKPVCRV